MINLYHELQKEKSQKLMQPNQSLGSKLWINLLAFTIWNHKANKQCRHRGFPILTAHVLLEPENKPIIPIKMTMSNMIMFNARISMDSMEPMRTILGNKHYKVWPAPKLVMNLFSFHLQWIITRSRKEMEIKKN